jgi:hypothetical protein
VRNIIKDYTYGKNCAYAAGSNNIIEHLMVIIKVEKIKAKALLDLRYIKNYINPK